MEWLMGILTWIVDKLLEPVKHRILNPEQREHDKKRFLMLVEFLKEEDVMTRLNELQSFGAYRIGLLSTEKFYQSIQHTGNQYMDRRIKNAALDVTRKLYKLLDFLSTEYTSKGDPSKDGWVQPNIKMRNHDDIGYEKFTMSRDKIVTAFRKAYWKYRRLIKQKLYV